MESLLHQYYMILHNILFLFTGQIEQQTLTMVNTIMTDASKHALKMLRDTSTLEWYVVPLLVIVIYVYINEIERKNWSAVFLGISLFFMELTWEQGNSLLLYLTNHSGLWTINGKTAYLIYSGYTIEIAFFFAIIGVMIVKALPNDRHQKIVGIPNRLFIPVLMGLTGLLVEIILNQAGMLVWEYWFWRFPNLILLAVGYCLPWFLVTWAHDNLTLRSKKNLSILLALAGILSHILLVSVMGII